MTVAEFKTKWAKYRGKETSGYQEHFNDLCGILEQKTPAEADPSGTDWFCFQKHVVKNLELLPADATGAEPAERKRGFADVWRKDCFGWEYKGRHRDLDEAYAQLQLYREALLNPPLLVTCDFLRIVVKTNFNGTVREVHEIALDRIDEPKNWRILRSLFIAPESLRPVLTTAQVTEHLAAQIGAIAKSLQQREADELVDAGTRAEMNFAQRKNLRIARFLNRIVFCFFAEDTGLLPANLFTDLLKGGLGDLRHFARTLETLFAVMARGGNFGKDKIRHFNGHLFEDSTVFEFSEEELKQLAEAGEADWQCIEPSIMGTLFQRALDERQRAALGAQYTCEPDIRDLVEPVLMAPLRREWAALKASLLPSLKQAKGASRDRVRLAAFLQKLGAITVLDPACGSGNFLYVSLQLLLGLEKEVVTFATQLGFKFTPQVSVQQLRALEINSYAFELAQVSVQIGFLQWRRDNGFDNDRTPVLQNLDGFQNEDALLVPHFRNKAKSLKEAQASEHQDDDALKFYTERAWPVADVIVGNPPFIGNKRMRSELGDHYSSAVFDTFGERLPATSDFCCYWFEKAREHVEQGKCQRAGLLATTGSKQVSSRRAFERIKETGKLFFAVSDRDWFDAGTAVRICMVGFGGIETVDQPVLDGHHVLAINADLTGGLDTTDKHYLRANANLCFMGTTKVGDFDLPPEKALALVAAKNPGGLPNSDVLRPFRNGSDLVRENSGRWIVDFGVGRTKPSAMTYALPFQHVVENVKEEREKNNRAHYRERWWIHAEPRPGFRAATARLPRYLATARVAKHRIFVWLDSVVLPDSKVIAIASDADSTLGLLQSRLHEVWTLATCGWHGIGNDATYNPTECFETFPFPFPLNDPPPQGQSTPDSEALAAHHYFTVAEDPAPYGSETHRAAVAAAAKELNDLRERWLSPPELTKARTLEFPGSVVGPWARYIVPQTIDAKAGVGTVRYPRLEPRNAECAAKLKPRTLTALYNERPAWLDLAHRKLDAAVAAAYGWPANLGDEEILTRLLALNLACAKKETEAAAVEAGKIGPKKTQRQKRDDEML